LIDGIVGWFDILKFLKARKGLGLKVREKNVVNARFKAWALGKVPSLKLWLWKIVPSLKLGL